MPPHEKRIDLATPGGTSDSTGAGLPSVADLAGRASEEARGVPADLLEGYLPALAKVSTGGQLCPDELSRRRAIGARAAEQNVPVRGVVDLYLSATWLAWSSLPGVREAAGADALRRIGEAVFRAADATITAVAEGYEEAQRWSLRQEESFRREFVDDLLDGRNVETLVGRAERYGLRLAGSYAVIVAAGPQPFVDGGPMTRQVESMVGLGPASRDVLVTTRDGLLVCIVPDAHGAVEEFVTRVMESLKPDGAWRLGVGRPQRGPGGAVRSVEQARQALQIGQRLQLPGHVHRASDLLVYQVLIRDRSALAELVEVVLEPIRKARTGPGTLLRTLAAYYAADRVATAAARELHVGVRTVTYRLDRVEELTGYSVHDPQQSFTLQVAVLGAQLLGWPEGS
ncbi:helix-turn-helix domain-containing protein [Streptomyces sp. NBC_00445]|uniref:PucR family transcriptional regulator n=1 Tax=unclassified Streptomyces TaxID=2593676 RepID=UPI002E23C2E3|nr:MULTISPECIES: helix-turn-helix domain-containing protein [unclassified Streptomyces]